MSTKLYELTDEDVRILRECITPKLMMMTFTGGPSVEPIAHAARALNNPDPEVEVK